jgi:hypothetical protein
MLLEAGHAHAEARQLCGQATNLDDFVGAFNVSIGAALLTGTQAGGKIALKGSHSFSAIMYRIGDELVLEAEGTAIPFRVAGEDEPDWRFDPLGDLRIDSADFEVLMGCPIRKLPRLIGQGMSKSTEGRPVEFTYRLIAYIATAEGIDELVGSLKWTGGGMGMSRVVRMSRR